MRNLIIFQSTKSSNPLATILAEEWHVFTIYDATKALQLLKTRKIHVGLCLIDSFYDELHLKRLKTLLSTSTGINWVIGITKQCLNDNQQATAAKLLIVEYGYDYLTLPIDDIQLLSSILGHAYGMGCLTQNLSDQLNRTHSYGMVGNSNAMKKFYKQMAKVIKSDHDLLIEGETGSGKGLVASIVHQYSKRAGYPFITVNCSVFPKELLQTELFGYEQGAFTGAIQRKIGQIELAQGGILFLDEIAELPLDLQAQLLHFLEHQTVQHIGSQKSIPVDVRVIAATRNNLEQAVAAGTFREDLYYKLKVLHLKLPPLRERNGDIEVLARYFFNKFINQQKTKTKGFCVDTLRALQQHTWPGNVRELRNCIHQALIISEGKLIKPGDLGLSALPQEHTVKTLDEARADSDRLAILNTLQYTRHNMSYSAELLGISRVSLYRLMNKYQINYKSSS